MRIYPRHDLPQMSAEPHFQFPGTPYNVQTQLMHAIHHTIETGKVGLFESPTGTGKTLSIICSTLTWLKNNRVALQHHHIPNDTEPDWVNEHTELQAHRSASDELTLRKASFTRRVLNSQKRPNPRLKTRSRPTSRNVLSDSDEEQPQNSFLAPSTNSNFKIIYATRTHSQLTQFVDELRKTDFGVHQPKFDHLTHDLPLSLVLFGSRKHSCIHQPVRALSSAAAISERCRELTEAVEQPSAASRKRARNNCPYKNQQAETVLRDKCITKIHNIEELAEAGKQIGACPYFATRQAIDSGDVDIIAVPYSVILHEQTRNSLNLTVDRNTVLVFDEAHNIVNTVRDLHSSVLTRPALLKTMASLQLYMQKYRLRFSPSNLFRIRQLLALLKGLLSTLAATGEKGRTGRVVHPSNILIDAGVDNINLYELVQYIDDSHLCKKLRGFVDGGNLNCSSKEKDQDSRTPGAIQEREEKYTKQSLIAFENFLRCVSDCSEYSRVAIYPDSVPSQLDTADDHSLPMDMLPRLKYFLVEPAAKFASSVKNAKSILLLGGTLTPRSAIKSNLLKHLDRGEVVEFECNHVVPTENVMTRVCGTGPSGTPLEFTYKSRRSPLVLDELGRTIESCIKLVNGGVVIFFSSYELLRHTTERWRTTGAFFRLSLLKNLILEERGSNDAFTKFQTLVKRDKKKGALLAAVMGGKLSEGINFSDELGRMVMVVGMPFANAMQLETGEVLRHIASAREKSEYLENECLTSVNQSIGRAVRHRKDFASIVLLDRRYSRSRSMQKLPGFVRRDLRVSTSLSELESDLKRFFDVIRDPS